MNLADGRIFKEDQLNLKQNDDPANLAQIEQGMKMFDDTFKEKKARELTRMERKWDRMTGATGQSFNNFKMGFMMGSMVGGGFGAVMGAYQAYATRQLLMIPLTMIASGGSFGFFMGLGMTFRSEG